ncbi:hypothetical protein MYX64_12060, partial [Nitrospinae bacterium AH_259_B05_G02_I21]|nr:hypothetical protein [Nitrospinae bacterium AH_259_B05_G02_I21]
MNAHRLTIAALVLGLVLVPAQGSAQQLFGTSSDSFNGALGGAIMGGILGAGVGALVKHDGKRRIGEGAAIGAGLGMLVGMMSA